MSYSIFDIQSISDWVILSHDQFFSLFRSLGSDLTGATDLKVTLVQIIQHLTN